jgi:hypothetical protein
MGENEVFINSVSSLELKAKRQQLTAYFKF